MALARGRCRLRYLLNRVNMTQAELGRRTGYSPQQVSNWVNDREKIPWDAALNIVYVLSCHMEDLYEIVNV
ncbi:helix-turn-helix transcriptional regulator [Paenibacillus dokdonensis]|uniref:Helix-turn-helix transcriptional regulator n=1 Tax=Paenibacillus dokdonensis TaxID=2567944 RepID=A0ABU6GQB8_9BACL|nr:helix-turn-helix transcriptional regulator [Paenibacillus dokdonensis]MEC0241951.1 helix-turn-helix transcriptional regulator [Paenibacillus dokdonensis]